MVCLGEKSFAQTNYMVSYKKNKWKKKTII